MAYKLIDPSEYLKKLTDASDRDAHNLLFITFVNETCLRKKMKFLGLAYSDKYDHGAKLVFEKDNDPHLYKMVNTFDPKEKDFRFTVDLAMYGRHYIYERDVNEDTVSHFLADLNGGKVPNKKEVEAILGGKK